MSEILSIISRYNGWPMASIVAILAMLAIKSGQYMASIFFTDTILKSLGHVLAILGQMLAITLVALIVGANDCASCLSMV